MNSTAVGPRYLNVNGHYYQDLPLFVYKYCHTEIYLQPGRVIVLGYMTYWAYS